MYQLSAAKGFYVAVESALSGFAWLVTCVSLAALTCHIAVLVLIPQMLDETSHRLITIMLL